MYLEINNHTFKELQIRTHNFSTHVRVINIETMDVVYERHPTDRQVADHLIPNT